VRSPTLVLARNGVSRTVASPPSSMVASRESSAKPRSFAPPAPSHQPVPNRCRGPVFPDAHRVDGVRPFRTWRIGNRRFCEAAFNVDQSEQRLEISV
jgi:hypothetical protein